MEIMNNITESEIKNKMLNVIIHRKFQLHGILIPVYIVFGYDVEEFKELITRYNHAQITEEQLKSELGKINILLIKNNENKIVEISNESTKVFVTNMNIENTKIHPLICSNQLTVTKDSKLAFEITQFVKQPQYLLTNITEIKKNEKNNNVAEVTASDVNIWTTNAQDSSMYKFGIPGKELSDVKKRNVINLAIEVCNEGNHSFICPNVHFKRYNGFDMVVFTNNNDQIANLWPIILRQSGLGIQLVYDLFIQYNEQYQEYNLVNVKDFNVPIAQKLALSGICGDIHTLELFLNYGLGAMRTQETYYLLMNSKRYNINGFEIVRDDKKVTVSVEDAVLKECINLKECEIFDEAFKLLIEYWYMP